MTEPFIGEIRMFGFNFAPRGWAMCDGQLLSISQNTALFSLLGTTYGGNGTSNFQLPNLQGRVPMHLGSNGFTNYVEGEVGGAETATLLTSNLPSHSHLVQGGTDGTTKNPIGEYPGFSAGGSAYTGTPAGTMNAAMVEPTGGNLPFGIVQPYLVINFCIALLGVFPSRN